MFGEPPPTQADLNFSLLGIQVRVHPFFWVVGLLLVSQGEIRDPRAVLLMIAAMFVSILIHEFGHALTARSYGYHPRVVLHGLGGLAIYHPIRQTTQSKIVITAAGPAAGFAFAGLVIGLLVITGQQVEFVRSLIPVEFRLRSPYLSLLVYYLLYINIYWSLINLLPVFPLDGGQIARELLIDANPHEGLRQSLILSIMTAIGLVIYSLVGSGGPSIFMALMFGYLAYLSFEMLQQSGGRGGGWW
jgi:Zn-dependent protease